MSKVEERGNGGNEGRSSESLAKAAQANYLEMAKREAVFRRYGYDSSASIAFVLSKILPLGGQVLELGSGKARFLAALARQVSQVTSVDIGISGLEADKHHFSRPLQASLGQGE
jgi:ubiquinone/menaquinone biosynthesis C-methylase UbiE